MTIISKKAIFWLHRSLDTAYHNPPPPFVVGTGSFIRCVSEGPKKEAKKMLAGIRDLQMLRIASELEGQDVWRYVAAISPGLQEYVEAVSFHHYLEHGTLITYKEIQDILSTKPNANGDPIVPLFELPLSDYLLGVSDLTGELMRFAIAAIGASPISNQANEICRFVRECHADFERLTPFVKGLAKKQQVTVESLKKIEAAIYGVVVRGSEYGDSQEAMQLVAQRYAAGRGFSTVDDSRHDSYGGGGGGGEGGGDEYYW
jgi:predicted translin family RNA/ssDNA-binding protein